MARNKAERQAAQAAGSQENKVQTETQTEDVGSQAADTSTQTDNAATQAPATEAKTTKSIVPAKYAGKYKNGGSDAVANFIKQECGEGDKFDFGSFFTLCKVNGLPEEKIEHYRNQVANETQGAKGRARMTLGNTLRAMARNNGKLLKQDGTEQALSVPKATLSGAAAAAKEANTQTSAAEGVTTDDGGTAQVVTGASEATGDVAEQTGETAQY